MSPLSKILLCCIFQLLFSFLNISITSASPDSTKIVLPDTLSVSVISTVAKIDTLINKNDPPVFINKFSKFKKLFDKIITRDGDTLTVLINKLSETSVEFNFPLNYRKEVMDKKMIISLNYSDGTIDTIRQKPAIQTDKPEQPKYSDKDWDKVLLLKSLDEASGADVLGEIASRFEGDRINVNSAYLEKSALILLKKKAARMGANCIYILNKDEYRAYGELPNMSIQAKAFYKPE
jgi:hypothetical protein